MSIALRLALVLIWDGYKVQRWPASIGLVLLLAGAIVAAGFDSPASIGLGIFGLIFLLTAPVLMGGALLRAISAPRIIVLIPHGRAQLLLAMMFCMLAMAGVVVGAIWLLDMDPPPPTPLFPIFTLGVALASLFMLGMFACSASMPGILLWSLTLGSTPYALALIGRHRQLAAEIFMPNRELLFAALLWAIFSIWYLRARFILPGDPTGAGATTAMYGGNLRVGKSRDAAIMALLLGQSTRSLLIGGIIGTAGMVLFAALMNSLPLNKQGDTVGVLGVLYFVFVTSGFGGFLATRRSKVLWLKVGSNRMQLFSLCERQSWFYFVTVSALMPLVVVALIAFSVVPAATILLGMVAFILLGAAVLYLGLMQLSEWRLVDLVIGLVLLAAWIGSFVWMHELAEAPHLAGLLAVPAAAVLLLRAEARRRWRNIDWLVRKLPRNTGLGAMSQPSR